MSEWSIDRARQRYNVAQWSEGYFDVATSGEVVARPWRDPARGEVSLAALAQALSAHQLSLPVLVRFVDILRDRVDAMAGAFAAAMREHGHAGRYTAVYPVKVNQQHAVVEQIVRHGGERVGLEAGSKPELMAVLGLAPAGSIVICNGYKDREYVRRALMARRLGHRAFIVIEKLSELALVIDESRALGVEPLLGVRVRLASIGSGNWQNTGGEKAKFGLSARQVLTAVERLKQAGLADCLELLHFHMGSQITNIRDIQRGMREAGRYLAELNALGPCIKYVDVGGGLGVDYEGTRSRSFCSVNYSLGEYANAIVRGLCEACVEHGLDTPDLITEAGRAMTAHHAVLLTNVIDVEVPGTNGREPPQPAADDPLILRDLWAGVRALDQRSPLEIWHDAGYWLSEAQTLFTHGGLSLAQRAHAEQLHMAICLGLRERLDAGNRAHRETLDQLEEKLAVRFFCNFSLFQSLPDVWAINQIFPIMPLTGLTRAPDCRGVIHDLTCDSDGRIDHYVDEQGVSATLPLHLPADDAPALLGFFLVGAYQEILGDMHNLFGDTDAVNVEMTADGGWRFESPERGDSADELLAYVHFRPQDLRETYARKIAEAGLGEEEKAIYQAELEAGLQGSTYLR